MSQTDVVKKFYRRNGKAIGFEENSHGRHGMTVKLDDYDVPKKKMRLNADDFPYIRLALIDKHLEATDA